MKRATSVAPSIELSEGAKVPEEVHISSLVVHTAPKRMQSVVDGIVRMRGSCVHGSSPEGKLVVTLEAASADEMLSTISAIQRLDGVLSAALVYQCADTLEAMSEEIPDAGD